jgi:hypothetical protein
MAMSTLNQAVKKNSVAEWLITEFVRKSRRIEVKGRPMIEFLSVMDAGEPMATRPADYKDDQRWWL